MERRFVEYRGVRMIEGWPERIQAAQRETHLTLKGVTVARVPYGSESTNWGADDLPCGDCKVVRGELHVLSCDIEECPVCHNQLITCDCVFDSDDNG